MTGFTYNGTHSSEFGLYYIPDETDSWIKDAEYDVYDADVSWKHGGYYYGNKTKVRTFTIKCMFEEIDVATRQAIKAWLHRDTNGTLVFDEIPFVYWNVHPGKIPVGEWYLDNNESHSGTVTITFNAYEPFGYLTRKSNRDIPPDNANDYCNLIDMHDMPADPTVSSTSFEIYNPGTENCGLTIEIAGTTSNPFRFYNNTNGTVCMFNSLPTSSLHLKIDGDTGFVSTFMSGSDSAENGFAYHDRGIVRLSPNYGRSNIAYRYLGKNGTLYIFELTGYTVTNNLIGANVMVGDIKFTVASVSRVLNRVFCTAENNPTFPESGTCTVRTMNNISIQEKSGNSWVAPSTLSLSYISVDYRPRAM